MNDLKIAIYFDLCLVIVLISYIIFPSNQGIAALNWIVCGFLWLTSFAVAFTLSDNNGELYVEREDVPYTYPIEALVVLLLVMGGSHATAIMWTFTFLAMLIHDTHHRGDKDDR